MQFNKHCKYMLLSNIHLQKISYYKTALNLLLC